MKKIFTLMCIFALSFSSLSATDYTIGSDDYDSQNTPLDTYNKYCLTQNLYLASELTAAGASAGNITAISFRVKSLTAAANRNIDVYITATNATQLTGFTNVIAGNKVFSGNSTTKKVTIPTSGWYTITLDDAFSWNGTSNILITIDDNTNNWTSGHPSHFCLWSGYSGNNRTAYYLNDATNLNPTSISVTANLQKYYPTIKFTIEAVAPSVPATPSDLAVSSVSSSSATLGWSSVSGATSYDLQQSANGSDWSTLSSGETGTSYTWTGLSASSTQYARIRAHNDAGYSDWSGAVTVVIDAAHEHNGISFSKWAATDALPTSGNYYLNDDVAFGWSNSDVTLTGNLNLCLNGKTADIFYLKIIVPSGKTLTIYDNVGGGKITGVVASEVGAFEDDNKALIVVKSGGTLVLKEGAIENNYDPDGDGSSYAIYSNGTLNMAGAPTITSKAVDIYLSASGVITLSGALTNLEKYSVMKYSGTSLTSGWNTYMSSADPKDYFTSANPNKSICRNGNEAALRTLLNLSESSANTSIGDNYNQTVDVNLTRSLTSSQYNTFCLPFALNNAELQAAFGAGYDLQEFVSSDLVDETLELTFNKVTALEAGKPYLLQPSVDVVNPSFEGVTIGATSPVAQTSDTYISFYGIYSPTELEGGNKNILFLGAENELFWPETTESLKGFRAYFQVKGGAAKVAKRARIINKEEAPTSLNEVQKNNIQGAKFIENGQLFILYNGTKYNVQGQVIK